MFKRLFVYAVIAFVCSIFVAVVLLDTKYVDIRIQEERPILDGLFSVINKQAGSGPVTAAIIDYWSGQFGYEIKLLAPPLLEANKADISTFNDQGSLIQLVSSWTQDRVTAYYQRGDQILKMSKLHLDKQAYLLYWQSILVTILVVLAFFVYCYVHIHKKYIKRLIHAYERYGKGELSLRIESEMPTPYSQLASNFNTMAAKIESLLAEHQHMLNGISHDLKTPLARLRFALDMTRTCHDISDYQETIQFMDEDLDALDELLDDWFLYADLQHARREAKIEPCRVDLLLTKIINRNQPIYAQVQAHTEITTGLVVQADNKLLGRAIENLVNNAFKFASSSIKVSAEQQEAVVVIRIEDDGPGIPEDKRDAVLKPFHRLDCSRNIPGIGLGLSIVASIVKSNHGQLNIEHSPLGGARITLHLALQIPSTSDENHDNMVLG